MTLDSAILELYKIASKPNYKAIATKLNLAEGVTSTTSGLTSILIGIEEPNLTLSTIGSIYTGFGIAKLINPQSTNNITNHTIYKPLRPILLAASSLAISSAIVLEKMVLDYSQHVPSWTYTAPLLFASFAANIFAATSRTYLQELQEKESTK